MRFKQFLELNLPHVNDIGHQNADKLKLIRGKTTAMNQSDDNCYEIAANLARQFGFEPPHHDTIRSLKNDINSYPYQKRFNPYLKPPVIPRPGIANFIVRDGDEFRMHVTFEYRGKEYNYGAASDQGFKILFRFPLKKLALAENVNQSLLNGLNQLRTKFASAAQQVYDDWIQDENDDLNGGGICQDIADAIATVVSHNIQTADAGVISSACGEQHVWCIVTNGQEAYEVDIPYNTYETGGGYSWKKIPNVRFNPNDIAITWIKPEDAKNALEYPD